MMKNSVDNSENNQNFTWEQRVTHAHLMVSTLTGGSLWLWEIRQLCNRITDGNSYLNKIIADYPFWQLKTNLTSDEQTSLQIVVLQIMNNMSSYCYDLVNVMEIELTGKCNLYNDYLTIIVDEFDGLFPTIEIDADRHRLCWELFEKSIINYHISKMLTTSDYKRLYYVDKCSQTEKRFLQDDRNKKGKRYDNNQRT